jgi:hypothetical protein
MATLLEKALTEPRGCGVALNVDASMDEQLDLAIAYCFGKVTGRQIAAATGYSKSNVSVWVGRRLCDAVKLGLLVRKRIL